MRALLFAMPAFLAATAIAGAAPSLADREGRWVCLPDDPVAPQVLIDFDENAYRRCDQNTCSSYEIQSVVRLGAAVEIAFAPGSKLRTDDAGGRYTEWRQAGDTLVTSTGTCAYRSDAPYTKKIRATNKRA